MIELKYAEARSYADPETAARGIMEIANTIEPAQGSKIYIELINYPMLFKDKASPAEYWTGLQRAIENGWLKLHESGTFVTFTPAGADLFA
jgi:hypothetical protein